MKALPAIAGDLFCDLALNRENIGQVAVVVFASNMGIASGIDQLYRHAHLSTCALDAALDNVR